MSECFVYLLEAENGLVKIGTASHVRDREQTARTHSPVKVRLIAYWSGGRDHEAALHEHFAAYRTHGEWFSLRDGFAAYVEARRGLNVPVIPEWDDLSFENRDAFKKIRRAIGRDGAGLVLPARKNRAPREMSVTHGLTPRQAAALSYIICYTEKHGCCPSFDEIRQELCLASKSGVHRIVEALVERGHVERMPNLARSLIVRSAPTDFFASAA